EGVAAVRAAEGFIATENALRDGKRPARLVLNTAAPASAVAEQTAACDPLGYVGTEHIVGQRQVAGVEDARPIGGQAVLEGQAGDRDSRSTTDIEDTAGCVAADGQVASAEAANREALVDQQLALGQGDGLALELIREMDCVAAVGGGENGA